MTVFDLSELVALAADEEASTRDLAEALAHGRAFKADLNTVCLQLQGRLVDRLGKQKIVEVDGYTIERRWSHGSSTWDHPAVLNAVYDLAASRHGGDKLAMLTEIADCLNPSTSWSSTALRVLNIDPDRYRASKPGHNTIDVRPIDTGDAA